MARALAKIELKQFDGLCADLLKASENDIEKANTLIEQYCE